MRKTSDTKKLAISRVARKRGGAAGVAQKDDQSKTKADLILELKAARSKIKRLEKRSAADAQQGRAMVERTRRDYMAILSNSSVGIQISDLKGRILFSNKAHHDIQGAPEGALIGKFIWSLLKSPEDRKALKKYYGQIVRSGNLEHGPEIALNRTQDGKDKHLKIDWDYMRDADGGPYAICSMITDITDQVMAENALKSQMNFIDRILDTVDAIVLVLDSKGHIVRFNSECERVSGYSFEEVQGRPIWDLLIPKDQVDAVRGVFARLTSGMFPNKHVNHWLTKDGSLRLISWSNTAMEDENGRVKFVIPTGIDITESRRAEEAMKRSLREKEVLLQEIHHRVKNNMAIIYSFLKLQSRQAPDPSIKVMFKDCQSRIKTMALVHEKLYMSEHMHEINLHDYVVSLLAYLFATYGVDGGTIGTELQIEDESFDIDTLIPIGLIINELVSNTLKHAFPDGARGRVFVHFTKGDVWRRLVVGDTGCGLPQGQEAKAGGSLGMQIVTSLVDQLRGSMSIQSAPGEGTKIIIEF